MNKQCEDCPLIAAAFLLAGVLLEMAFEVIQHIWMALAQ
jgi:hypothetical protein